MKYHIVTFGCQMNKSDSERIAASLENKGHKPVLEVSGADLVVVNMCSVRQSAVDRVSGLQQKLSKLKIQNSKFKTVLTGCILKKDKIKLRRIFDEIWDNETRSRNETESRVTSKFIPISSGCNNFCTYCVVPHTRGPLVCRNYEEILKEVKNSVKNGVKEIWLLGQNVNDYISEQKTKKPCLPTGRKKQKINFAELLKTVNDIPGDFQIRFTSPNPADFSDKLIEVMAECKKVAKFLNLPLQSGDNKILKKMNRPYTVGQYKKLVEKIRKRIPDINLSADAIVGFPGETKKQFENTVKLFKEIEFNIAYISKYSPRPGTAAFLMKDDIPLKEKKRREKILINLLKTKRKSKHPSLY